jgi:adenine/guanine phosphoribosyltransferase-like PRPP-binding protein
MKTEVETPVVIKTDYLHNVYNIKEFKKKIKKLTAMIKAYREKEPFDSIAFCGTSGAAFAYPLSLRLNIPLIHVRKDGVKTHATSKVEGNIGCKSYIIVDDLIFTGTTIRYIKDTIAEYIPSARYKRVFLYGEYLQAEIQHTYY